MPVFTIWSWIAPSFLSLLSFTRILYLIVQKLERSAGLFRSEAMPMWRWRVSTAPESILPVAFGVLLNFTYS